MAQRSSRKPARGSGIEVRHRRTCAISAGGGRCSCTPGYRVEVTDGRNRRIRRTFPTLAAAEAFRRDAVRERAEGRLVLPSRRTVREVGEELVAGMRDGSVRNRSGLPFKPSVVASYASSLATHVYPSLGAVAIGDVSRRDVQALVERMLAAGKDASTVRNALMPLRVIFRRAIAAGDVAASPLAHLELPSVIGRRDRFADVEEARALVDATSGQDRAFWSVALFAGLRFGEIAGLRWSDVDFKGGALYVRQAWSVKGRVMVAPKSRAGERTVPLVQAAREALSAWRTESGGGTADLVFRGRSGGPLDLSTVQGRSDTAWRNAGLPRITPHEARHSFASMMAAARVPIEDLSEYMGHSSFNVTVKRYRHLYPDARSSAVAMFDSFAARADTAARLVQLDS